MNKASPARPATTLLLCLLVAILEGVDIQSVGAAAPRLVPEFGLSQTGVGILFSASLIGLMGGAMVGGRLSDIIGRKAVLIGSVGTFGLFSLSTPFAWDEPTLLLTRFLTGLGLGGAMPNLIALTAENSPERWRRSLTTLMWAGTPSGGLIAAQLAATTSLDWRVIFYAGGIGPLLMVPLMIWLLPESSAFFRQRADAGPKASKISHALFGEGRATTTLLLWPTYFLTLLLLHLLLNWLPMLIVGQGFGKLEAAQGAIWFNIGGVSGAIFFAMMLRVVPARTLFLINYAGIAIGLVGLATVGGNIGMLMASALLAGAFVMGAQFMLYGVVADFYPARIRGTGVGAAVAAGRAGSVTGPFAVGVLLSAGLSIPSLLLGLLPIVLVAATAITVLLSRPNGGVTHSPDIDGAKLG